VLLLLVTGGFLALLLLTQYFVRRSMDDKQDN